MIYELDQALLERVFPFHIVLDPAMRIAKHGPSLAKIAPSLGVDRNFRDHFKIRTPRIEPDFEALREAAKGQRSNESIRAGVGDGRSPDETDEPDPLYVLEHLASGLSFRMQMVCSDNPPALIFVGSPLLKTRKQLDRYSLTLSDFAPFDCSLDYLVALRMKDSLIEKTTRLTTDLEVMNHDLQEQVDARLAADQAKDLFLATMSHEIRTPLNAITGLTSLLRKMDHSTTALHHLATIETAARTLQRLIDGILDFSKVESGSLEHSEEDFDLGEIADQAARLFSPLAREKGLELRHAIHPATPRALRGEAALFNRVLSNLTHNAIKFTREGSVSIALSGQPDSKGMILRAEIEDTGIGIAEQDQERIFERFTRVHEPEPDETSGSGLGLAISRRICESCGGQIGVESTLGKGSIFWFEFPLALRAETSLERGSKSLGEPAGESEPRLEIGLPILVVEDNAINRNMIVDMLEWLGVEADAVEDGMEALRRTADRDFGAILMDIQLPGLDGHETTRRLRQRGGRNALTPIIGLSANAFRKDRAAGLAAGMNDYLAKPITLESLTRVLQRWPGVGLAAPTARKHPVDGAEGGNSILTPEVMDLVASSPLLADMEPSGLVESLGDFVEEAPATLAALNQALDVRRFTEVGRLAHNLKGSALFLGLDTLTALATQLEETSEGNDTQGVHDSLTRVNAEVSRVVATLEAAMPRITESHQADPTC